MKLIDLSHRLEPGMVLFSQAAPQPRISPWMSHEEAAASGTYDGCTCELTEVQFVTSMGTYMDSPYHFNPKGGAIDTLTLEQTVLPGIVIDCTDIEASQPIEPARLEGHDIDGKAVLFHTGWDRFWGQEAYRTFPFVSGATANALRDRGAKLAGVDFLVIDDTTDPTRPVHVTLLHNDILIIENLTNLGALPKEGFVLHAAPVKMAGAAAFPVRAYGVVG